MPPLVQRFLGSLLRFALAPVFGWLANKEIIPVSDSTEYLTEIVLWTVAFGWELWVKYQDRLSFLAAKYLPAKPTGEAIKEAAQSSDIKAMAFQGNTDHKNPSLL